MTRAILVVFLILLAAVLLTNRSEAIFGADSSGYANLARMLDEGEVTRALPVSCRSCGPASLTPLGFVPLPDHRIASFYPIGLPLHLLVAARIGGWTRAPFFVSPLAGLFTVLLTFWLGRRLHSEVAGLVGAMAMGFCAVFVFQALQPMSDVLAAMWSVAAVSAAVEGRERPGWNYAAGLCFGIAVLVRPTSALMIVPLAFALGDVKAAVRFAAGGLPAAFVLGAYNLTAFGSLLGTGYEAGGATREFALGYFPARVVHYLRWTAEQFGPAILAAVVALAARFVPARTRWLLGTWFAAFVFFYSFYWFYDEWWYTRFLLPAYPAVAVAAGIAFARLIAWRRNAGTLLVILALAWEAHEVTRFAVLQTDEDQQFARAVAEWAGRKLPPGSMVLSMEYSGALLYYTSHKPVRWDSAALPEVLALAPPYALLMPHEEAPFVATFGGRYRRTRSGAAGTLFVLQR